MAAAWKSETEGESQDFEVRVWDSCRFSNGTWGFMGGSRWLFFPKEGILETAVQVNSKAERLSLDQGNLPEVMGLRGLVGPDVLDSYFFF